MKFTFRIWLLAIVLIVSVAVILNTTTAATMLIMALLVGVALAIHLAKSKWVEIGLPLLLIIITVLVVMGSFQTGAVIKSIDRNSSTFEEGVRAGEIVKSINSVPIFSKADYYKEVGNIVIDPSTMTKVVMVTDKQTYNIFTNQSLSLIVDDVPKTRIQTGLDLRGGARALVQPDAKIDDNALNDLIQISRNRFNVYGLSDVQISGVRDLSGNKFLLVEVAGATPKDLEDLISNQGKFEAKVGNTTVFEGGKRDISGVCRNDASCAGITQCSPASDGTYYCNFRFTIYLTEDSANRHANITKSIPADDTGRYLRDKLYLYVDGQEVDSLLIGIDLKGQVTTQVSIQGSGQGKTQEEAFNAAKASMNKLQTVLITGSLPYKLNIVKLDTISPTLGENFSNLLLLAGAGAMILVGLIIFLRYRHVKASFALIFTSFSELVIILGVAAFIKWNLDLPSIAGILATIGTGVDSQIVILDEAEHKSESTSLKDKIKIALFIIITAYATNVVSLIPLYWAGAGLFKGFAITTIIGVTAGVFISRPAFADLIKKIEE